MLTDHMQESKQKEMGWGGVGRGWRAAARPSTNGELGLTLCHTHLPATVGLRLESGEPKKRRVVIGEHRNKGFLHQQHSA